MAKPSLAEALGSYGDKPEKMGPSEHGDDPDAEIYVQDLAAALDIDEGKAREVYDVICAIFESKVHKGDGHNGGGELTLILGR